MCTTMISIPSPRASIIASKFAWQKSRLWDHRILTSLHFGLRRSDYRTPVKGLYLCGSGAHPGGGVMGAPGRNAASVVLEDLIKAKK
jgi:hypothetical protein